MKKTVTKLLLLLISYSSFSQKQYEFDYVLEYKINVYKDSAKIKNHNFIEKDQTTSTYYYTNSKDNSYYAIVQEKDSTHYKFNFIEHKGISTSEEFLKTDIHKAETIHINCKNIFKITTTYKSEDFELIQLKDTLIYHKKYPLYKFNMTHLRKRKKEKMGANYYIIDTSFNTHLPLLFYPILYKKWKLLENTPTGIIKERFYIDYYGRLAASEKFVGIKKTEKKIFIPKKCN
ncbi:MAG: hypothetical protein KBE41_02490 [Lutibacter sp.]|nr:hypothetical protein [Lutibacter sp.]MBP9600347.1 hypothetical protein [Lutibacter sp.]